MNGTCLIRQQRAVYRNRIIPEIPGWKKTESHRRRQAYVRARCSWRDTPSAKWIAETLDFEEKKIIPILFQVQMHNELIYGATSCLSSKGLEISYLKTRIKSEPLFYFYVHDLCFDEMCLFHDLLYITVRIYLHRTLII